MSLPKKHTHPRKKGIFYLIAVSLPFLFFAILEGGLRIIGYGSAPALFIENPANPNYILPRPDLMSRYFRDPNNRPSVTLEANFLLKEKPADGLRFFVQGGSTAAGFPYGMGASIAGTLENRLRQTFPNRYVEVINTALSAVNSYTMLDIADEIIAQGPDAVLIYAGHNEYLGIFGVGSSFKVAHSSIFTRLFFRFKNLRLFQLFQDVFGFFRPASPQTNAQARTFMAKAAAQNNIAFDSPMFHAGLSQFETNIARLLAKYRAANIPVFIANIASNQSGQKPFNSLPIEANSSQLLDSIAALDRASQLVELKKLSTIARGSYSADLHFKLGQAFSSLGDAEYAATHFLLATDYDQLRFRAPQQINAIVEQMSQSQSVYLVDAKRYMQNRSPQRIIGDTLMLEHLHPNLSGYYIISEAFYQAIADSQLFSPFNHISIEQAWSERLVLPGEEYFGFATIQNLKSDYPFTSALASPQAMQLPQPTGWQQTLGLAFYEKRIDWLTFMQRSLSRYEQEGNAEMAQKTLQILADALPSNGLYNVQIAERFEQRKNYVLASHYYRRAQNAGMIDKGLDKKIRGLQAKAMQP